MRSTPTSKRKKKRVPRAARPKLGLRLLGKRKEAAPSSRFFFALFAPIADPIRFFSFGSAPSRPILFFRARFPFQRRLGARRGFRLGLRVLQGSPRQASTPRARARGRKPQNPCGPSPPKRLLRSRPMRDGALNREARSRRAAAPFERKGGRAARSRRFGAPSPRPILRARGQRRRPAPSAGVLAPKPGVEWRAIGSLRPGPERPTPGSRRPRRLGPRRPRPSRIRRRFRR